MIKDTLMAIAGITSLVLASCYAYNEVFRSPSKINYILKQHGGIEKVDLPIIVAKDGCIIMPEQRYDNKGRAIPTGRYRVVVSTHNISPDNPEFKKRKIGIHAVSP